MAVSAFVNSAVVGIFRDLSVAVIPTGMTNDGERAVTLLIIDRRHTAHLRSVISPQIGRSFGSHGRSHGAQAACTTATTLTLLT